MVELSVDGGLWREIATDGAQYTLDWDTTTVADRGPHAAGAGSEDNATATDRVTVIIDDDGPPVVSVPEPAAGVRVEGNTVAVVSAADDRTTPTDLTVEVSLTGRPWRTTEYDF